MSIQTNHYKLTKDSSNDFYNVDTINQNLDKIDKGMNDNKNQINTKSHKTHNHNAVYEPIITKKTGFNLDKSDSLTNSSTNTLATSNAIKTLNDKLKEVNSKLEENSIVDFETCQYSVSRCPSEARGLFSPIVEGVIPLWNIATEIDWSAHQSTLTKTADIIQISGNGKSKAPSIYNVPLFKKNSKYYVAVKSRVTNEECQEIRIVANSTQGILDSIKQPIANKWNFLSGARTVSEDGNKIFEILQVYETAEKAKNKVLQADEIIIIDVSNENGTDAEIKAKYDSLGYIDGFTPTILKYELNSRWKNKINPLYVADLNNYVKATYYNKPISLNKGKYYIKAIRKKKLPADWYVYICMSDTKDNPGAAGANSAFFVYKILFTIE